MIFFCKWIIFFGLFFLISLSFLSPEAYATHSLAGPLRTMINQADYVFVGEALETSRTLLGYHESKIKLITVVKGTPATSMVVKYGDTWFQPQVNVPRLKTDRRYLFFVSKKDDELWLIGSGPKYYLIEENGEVLCGDEKILITECIERGRKIVSNQGEKSNF